jgi:hypothetical protein
LTTIPNDCTEDDRDQRDRDPRMIESMMYAMTRIVVSA